MPRTDSSYYGRVAYEGYRQQHGYMDPSGKELVEWDLLGEDEQRAWVAGGDAAVLAYQGES